jgi:hypothetical protein
MGTQSRITLSQMGVKGFLEGVKPGVVLEGWKAE